MQNIVTRRTECDFRCSFARKRNSWTSTREFFDLGSRVGKCDGGGSAELRPTERHRRAQIPWRGAGRSRELSVILNPDSQIQGYTYSCGAFKHDDARPLNGRTIFCKSQNGRCIPRCQFPDRRDLVIGMQACRNHEFLTIRDECPDQFTLAEIGRHAHGEHPPLPSGQEMGGLVLIRSAGVDSIVRPDRDIEFLFCIAIEIAKQEAEGPVRILEPALESAGYAGAGFMDRFEWQVLRSCESAHS